MCKKAFDWCCKNGIFVYVVPLKGSDGQQRPKCRLVVKSPNKRPRTFEEVFSQTQKGQLEMAKRAREIYKLYYRANNKG